MPLQPAAAPVPEPSPSGVFPALVFVQGNEHRAMPVDHTPFTVGRRMDKDLVIPDPRVSRDHAIISSEDGEFYVVDQGSKHGTFVNGEKIQRRKLKRNDRLEFGVRDGCYAIFHPDQSRTNTARGCTWMALSACGQPPAQVCVICCAALSTPIRGPPTATNG